MSEPGPFDRILESSATRDRSARGVLMAMGVIGVVLLLLVLVPGSPLHSKGGGVPSGLPTASSASSSAPAGSSTSPSTTSAGSASGATKLPKVPDGYE